MIAVPLAEQIFARPVRLKLLVFTFAWSEGAAGGRPQSDSLRCPGQIPSYYSHIRGYNEILSERPSERGPREELAENARGGRRARGGERGGRESERAARANERRARPVD